MGKESSIFSSNQVLEDKNLTLGEAATMEPESVCQPGMRQSQKIQRNDWCTLFKPLDKAKSGF